MSLVRKRSYRTALGRPNYGAMARVAGRTYGALSKYSKFKPKYRKGKPRAGPSRVDAPGGGNAVYQDHHLARDYVRRKPRKSKLRKIRRAKFMKMVNCSPQTFIRDDNWKPTSVANKQIWTSFMLYEFNGQAAVSPNNRDVSYITALTNPNAHNVKNTTYLFDTAIQKIQCVSTENDSIELTFYTVKCRKDVPYSSTGSGTTVDIVDHFSKSFAAQNQVNLPSSAITQTITDLGITPFHAPQFCKHWVIMHVKKIILGPNENYTQTMKDYKNKVISGCDVEEVYAKAGITWGYLVSVKGVRNAVDTPVVAPEFVSEKKYNVKFSEEQNAKLQTF